MMGFNFLKDNSDPYMESGLAGSRAEGSIFSQKYQ